MGYPTLFQVDELAFAYELAQIVDGVAGQLTQNQFDTSGRIKLVDEWL